MQKLINILIIRACKSTDPNARLKSVYKRFWLNTEKTDPFFENTWRLVIMHQLVDIASEMNIKISNLLHRMEEHDSLKRFLKEDTDTWRQMMFNALVAEIRFTAAKDLPDWVIPPKKFRKG